MASETSTYPGSVPQGAPLPPAGAQAAGAQPVSIVKVTVGAWPLLLGMLLLTLGSGLGFAVIGLRSMMEGFSTTVAGLIASSYSVGYVIGSVFAPRLVRNVGHVRVFGALASLASVAALSHAVLVDAQAWMAARVVFGFCYAGIYVVAESWLNESADEATRGRLLSLYMIAMLTGLGAGPLLINVSSPEGPLLFVGFSALVSLAAVPMLLSASATPRFRHSQPLGVVRLFKLTPAGVAGCFVSGVSNAAVIGLAPVYADQIGLSVGQVSLFVGAPVLGGMVLLWVIGPLSDRFDRRTVLAAVTALAALAALVMLGAADYTPFTAVVAVAIFGGLSFPTYSLALAHANDRLDPVQMVSASSALVLVTGVGAVVGPALAATFMDRVGPQGLFGFAAAVHALFGLFVLWRMLSRAPIPLEEQLPPVYLTRSSSLAAGAALEHAREQAKEDAGTPSVETPDPRIRE